jgi:hypothetical protein
MLGASKETAKETLRREIKKNPFLISLRLLISLAAP